MVRLVGHVAADEGRYDVDEGRDSEGEEHVLVRTVTSCLVASPR